MADRRGARERRLVRREMSPASRGRAHRVCVENAVTGRGEAFNVTKQVFPSFWKARVLMIRMVSPRVVPQIRALCAAPASDEIYSVVCSAGRHGQRLILKPQTVKRAHALRVAPPGGAIPVVQPVGSGVSQETP